MKTFIVHTPEKHITDRGYSGIRYLFLLITAADPVSRGIHVNRVSGKFIGFYFGIGKNRYFSVGRYRTVTMLRRVMIGRRNT